ncbi:MAG: DUF1800 domain-containing protein [Pirellulales bacterium]
MTFNELDPARAWSAFEPTATTPWDRAAAAHLFRRIGFGADSGQLDDAAAQKPADVVRRLVRGENADEAATKELDTLGDTVAASGNPEALAAWWLHRMIHTTDAALEKLTLFWHGHFATSGAKVRDSRLMLAQNRMFRQHARGRFAEMVQAVSRDPAMLLYLDSATNRKVHPNENYAREVMELFCLGLDNYTERDIQETARAFTGWEVRSGRFRFNSFQHDTGEKTLFGQRGNYDGDAAIAIILDQPAAARFIAGKLFRYYIADEPAPRAELIEPIAEMLRENGFEIGPVVERMAGSELFFSPHARGRKIRSPVELAIDLLKGLETTTNTKRLAEDLLQLGQGVFFPPNVKGWDGGRSWLNSSTLLGRANLARRLVEDSKDRFADGSLAALVEKHANSPEKAVDWLAGILLAKPLADESRKTLVEVAARGDRSDAYKNLVAAVGTLPEFQLG